MTSYLVSGISPGSAPSRPLSTRKEAELLQTETRCCRCSPPKLPLPLRTKSGLLPKPTKALKPGDPTPRVSLYHHLPRSVLLGFSVHNTPPLVPQTQEGPSSHRAWPMAPLCQECSSLCCLVKHSWDLRPHYKWHSLKGPLQTSHCKEPPGLLSCTFFFVPRALFTLLNVYHAPPWGQ